METLADFIVVGSGPSGAMAAQTLHERGANVLMLDAGNRDQRYDDLIPDASFTDIRKGCAEQHRFFLGDEFESIPRAGVGTGAQLTPPRQSLVRDVDRFLALDSETFAPMESLAYGGLGAGWGLGCCVFSDRELTAAGLDASDMRAAYQVVASRIGISANADDARPYTFDGITGTQPAVPLDPTCAVLSRNYERKRSLVQGRGFHLGRPALALLTQDFDQRRATQLREMEFYDDKGLAAWRPWITVDRLRRESRFVYRGGLVVTSFEERDGLVIVSALDMHDLHATSFTCRKLVLASGTLGTARIVLRSGPAAGSTLPLLCNPYTYLATIVPARIGAVPPDRASALGQLVLFHDPNGTNDNVALASLYTYRSLLTFRLAAQMPISMRDGLALLRYLQPALVIAGIHHPDRPSAQKMVRRVVSGAVTGDALHIDYALTQDERRAIAQRERAYLTVLRALGAWTARRVTPGFGSSIHYAGTLPFSDRPRPGSLDPTGRLHGCANVYVADGSGFTYLPAKSLTLSLMANAHLVAQRLA